MKGSRRCQVALAGSLLIHLALFAAAGAFWSWDSIHVRQPIYVEVTMAELVSPVEEAGGGSKQNESNNRTVPQSGSNLSEAADVQTSVAALTNGPMNDKAGTGSNAGGTGGGIGTGGTGTGIGTGSGPTRGPLVVDGARPEYPESARIKGWEGTVKLQILVNIDGRVEDVRMVVSSGHAELDQTALRAVRLWRFSPALQKGVPVAAWATLPVVFDLR